LRCADQDDSGAVTDDDRVRTGLSAEELEELEEPSFAAVLAHRHGS